MIHEKMRKYRFSIISICYNCETEVEKTVQSLKKQTFKNYEYIVIDGASTDHTLHKIYECTKGMENVRIFSEPDKGIYDAMNKGLEKVEGEYIYFLNIGDELYDPSVLSIVDSELESGVDFYYGNIVHVNNGNKNIILQKNKGTIFWALYREYMICHQSIFAGYGMFTGGGFDCSYQICADREWLIRKLRTGAKGKYINYPIAYYDDTGISSNYDKFEKESIRLSKEYGMISYCFVVAKRFIGHVLGSRKKNE